MEAGSKNRLTPLLGVLGVLAIGGSVALWLGRIGSASTAVSPHTASAQHASPRIVSLFPPATETLYTIGASDQVIGRSDYCRFPDEVWSLPATGTSLRPNAEALVRLRPTLLVSDASVQTVAAELVAIAPVELLPWLTLPQIVRSVRRLGELTGRTAAADALARTLQARLQVPAPLEGPRVLLTMGQAAGNFSDVWFLRRNSVHGAALHAAGARNAVDEDIVGTPSLSLERLVQLDPEIVIVLVPHDDLSDAARARILNNWQMLSTLSAVRNDRIAVHNGAWLFSSGPLILELVDLLERDLAELWDE